MANRLDIKTKTFFQIPPQPQKDYHMLLADRVVFMDQGFDLTDIKLITEVYQVTDLCYRFFVHISHSEWGKLAFDFKRKGDALMAQRELSRAWAKTGEFAYDDENVDAGEGSNPQ